MEWQTGGRESNESKAKACKLRVLGQTLKLTEHRRTRKKKRPQDTADFRSSSQPVRNLGFPQSTSGVGARISPATQSECGDNPPCEAKRPGRKMEEGTKVQARQGTALRAKADAQDSLQIESHGGLQVPPLTKPERASLRVPQEGKCR